MNKTIKILFILIVTMLINSLSYGQRQRRPKSDLGYELIIDVPYGTGMVKENGDSVDRELLLDLYLPSKANKDYTKDSTGRPPYPAVILVHGGGYQRSGPREATLY